MNQLKSLIVLLMIAATPFLAGCSDNDEKTKPIIVENETVLTQDVYADKTEGSGVSFTTIGAWTSSIKSVASARETSTSTPEWISLNPSSGNKAGTYTVAISLVPNETGADRSAVISILCEGSEITINITQKGTKEDGKVPGKTVTFNVYSCNDQWTPENDIPYLAAKDAEIKVYNGTTLVGTYITNENGIAEAELEEGEYTYTVTKGAETNLTPQGYIINGIYTTEDGVSAEGLGRLKVCDLNGDGIINANDAVEKATLSVTQNETIEVYIVASDFTPVYDPFVHSKIKSRMLTSYNSMIRNSYLIDASITREVSINEPKYKAIGDFSFDSSNEAIKSMWNEAYTTIKNANLILENLDNIPNTTDEEKHYCEAEARYYRLYAYSVLLNYFGGVPIQATSSFADIPRNSVQEVANFIFDDGDVVIAHGDNLLKYSACQVMARIALNKSDYMDSYPLAKRIIDSGQYRLSNDLWNDPITNQALLLTLPAEMRKADGSYSLPVRYTETLLLFAESALGLGNTMEALQAITPFTQVEDENIKNIVPHPGATQEEIRNAIYLLWEKALDREAHTFALLKRTNKFIEKLNSYGATEKHLLLPIPISAIRENITQNFGW